MLLLKMKHSKENLSILNLYVLRNIFSISIRNTERMAPIRKEITSSGREKVTVV